MSTTENFSPSSGKQRYHMASSFYLYCRSFIEEQTNNGHRFRTEKQGFERAALKWNELSEKEKNQWKIDCREERKRCKENGTIQKIKIRNGDRGDRNADPTELAWLKDLSLKKNKDVEALWKGWTWFFSGNEGLYYEPFLIVNVIPAAPKSTAPFSQLAIIEFDLANGITDQFSVKFDPDFADSNAVYEAVRCVLAWPARIDRRLNESPPVFFVPTDQMAIVFDALTYVATTTNLSIFDPKAEISLASDLAEIDVLVKALAKFFVKPISEKSIPETSTNGSACALTGAYRIAGYILNDFGV